MIDNMEYKHTMYIITTRKDFLYPTKDKQCIINNNKKKKRKKRVVMVFTTIFVSVSNLGRNVAQSLNKACEEKIERNQTVLTSIIDIIITKDVLVIADAKYSVHCISHCLNLAIGNSCQKVPIIRNSCISDIFTYM